MLLKYRNAITRKYLLQVEQRPAHFHGVSKYRRRIARWTGLWKRIESICLRSLISLFSSFGVSTAILYMRPQIGLSVRILSLTRALYYTSTFIVLKFGNFGSLHASNISRILACWTDEYYKNRSANWRWAIEHIAGMPDRIRIISMHTKERRATEKAWNSCIHHEFQDPASPIFMNSSSRLISKDYPNLMHMQILYFNTGIAFWFIRSENNKIHSGFTLPLCQNSGNSSS